MFVFFFSSRRRHTRYWRDWSSDVCSSDLTTSEKDTAMHGESILVDIGLAIVAATALAYLARMLRQPLLLAYIGAGLLIGPPLLGLVHNEEEIAEIAELGLAFLMFIVGLEIDLKKLV